MLKPMTAELRKKIQLYRKNRLDISKLIEGINIANEDLSYCIINKLILMHEDISKCDFSYAIIGLEGQTTILTGCKLHYCSFKNTTFKGTLLLKRVEAHNCNFHETFMPFVDYQHADFRGSTFCDCVARMGGRAGHGAIIDKSQIVKWGLKFNEEIV